MRWTFACLLLACTTTHGARDAGMDGACPDAPLIHSDGGADAASGCEPPSEVEIERLRERIRRAWCERIDPCDDWRRWPDVESCMRHEAGAQLAAISWSTVREGEVLDIDAADACLAQLECPYLVGWPFGVVTDGSAPRCEPFRRLCAGQAGLGERCVWTSHCERGLFCDGGECDTCQPRLPTGAPCPDGNAAYMCMRGSSGELALCMADAPRGPHRCRIGRVAEPAGEGEPCGPIGLPADVLDLVPCAEGLRCIEDEASSGPTCVRPGGLGEPCAGAGCAVGLVCAVETSTCGEPEVIVPIPVGAPCEARADAFTCDGQWGTECVDGICVASRGEGQPCDTFWPDWDPFRTSECDPPLFCASGTCARPTLPLGTSCEWPAQRLCASGCCDLETNLCAAIEVCSPEDRACADR